MRKKPHYSGPRNNNNNNNNNNKRRFVRKPGGGGGGGGRFGGGGGGDDSDFVNPRMRKQAQTNREKYLAMAKDALSSGDRVESEYYLQHADHYLRIMNAIDAQFTPRPHQHAQDPSAQGAEDMAPQEENMSEGAAMEYADAPEPEAPEDLDYDENAGAQLASVLPAPKMAGM